MSMVWDKIESGFFGLFEGPIMDLIFRPEHVFIYLVYALLFSMILLLAFFPGPRPHYSDFDRYAPSSNQAMEDQDTDEDDMGPGM